MRTISPDRFSLPSLIVISAILITCVGASADDELQSRQGQINRLNVITGAPVTLSAADPRPPGTPVTPYPLTPATEVSEAVSVSREMAFPGGEFAPSRGRRSLGSTSVNAGQGRGESIDLTFFDIQSVHENGRQIAHWYNGLTGPQAEVNVHFGYVDGEDTSYQYYWPNAPYVTVPNHFWTAYNVYDATKGGDWPKGPDDGCELQITDTAGAGYTASLDMMHNGRVVMGGDTRTRRFYPEPYLLSFRIIEGYTYYQSDEFNCNYNPYTPLNVSWVDTSDYRWTFLTPPLYREGVYLRNPQVCTQWDGTNTIVHLLAGENSGGVQISAPGYGDSYYWVWLYFRKIGDTYSAGTWEQMIPIDTIDFVNMHLAAQDYPGQGVAVAYANISPNAIMYNKPDRDVFCRESIDRGVTWQPSYNITSYDNLTKNGANHGTASIEVHCMYDSENDLHVWFAGNPTSAEPYVDGFNWYDYNRNLYHWEKTNGNAVPGVGEIVKVANGNFMNPDQLTGGINQLVCGFGGSNAGYIAWSTMGECDGKLYLVWSQIHEKANADWTAWQNSPIQPAPGILDDCSRVGNRGGRANWELMMSVARMSTSTLWDYPRNISNTYRPNCGLPDEPEAETICASEWKPQLEKRALDETGLELTWPENSKVDMSPPGQTYTGNWYLNMEYLDDQYPGPAWWGARNVQGMDFHNPPPTWNSEKWIRLACVEPIEASEIDLFPDKLEWPTWVRNGQATTFSIRVINEGNVALNIDSIIKPQSATWLSFSEAPSSQNPFCVAAGLHNVDTFHININSAGFTQPTWLETSFLLLSDAANADTFYFPIRILAADTVEPATWDTVMSHEFMFDPFLQPAGECVALAVSNHGEIGGLGGTFGRVNWIPYALPDSAGKVNLDYRESGQECGTRVEDAIYLYSGSPFVILANSSDGSDATLTCSYNDRDQADVTGWDPTPQKGSMSGGLAASGAYDSVYTGMFVNRDTTIAMERIFYSPRSAHPQDDTISFVICYTKVYSADGQAHNHTTIGNVIDWNVPSDISGINRSGIMDDQLSNDILVMVTGADTAWTSSCQSNTYRSGAEGFLNGYTSSQFQSDPCIIQEYEFRGMNASSQNLLEDTAYHFGIPVDPPQPNPLAWWQLTQIPGLNDNSHLQNQVVWLTYVHDYSLSATDTLNFWTALITTRDMFPYLYQVYYFAKYWFWDTLRPGCYARTCCSNRVGDANLSRDYPDEVTLGDIMLMVDVKFISGDCSMLQCIAEADVNQDGGVDPTCEDHVTLGDIMRLVDFLFITGPENSTLPDCL